MVFWIGFSASQDRACHDKEFYMPCICVDGYQILPILQCDTINRTVLQRIFNQTAVQYFASLNLSQLTSDNGVDIAIPHKVLKNVERVDISCQSKHFPFKFEPIVLIDPLPENNFFPLQFRSILQWLTISDCNLGQLNYEILYGLTDLIGFDIGNSINIYLDSTWTHTFYSMTALSTLGINGCRNVSFLGLQEDRFHSSSSVKLTILVLVDNQLDDNNMDIFLSWTVLTSAGSLSYLNIEENALSRIPSQIVSFRSLKQLVLSGNKIPIIKKGSLAFTYPISFLILSNCSIETIEHGAFKGNIINRNVFPKYFYFASYFLKGISPSL